MSYYLAVTLNSGVGWTLRFVQFVTTFPPTSCDDSSCTWGPWVDDDGLNRWKLYVQKVDGAYEYVLSAQPGSTPPRPSASLISRHGAPVRPRSRLGDFTIDFDAQDALDHGGHWVKKDFGRLDVTYDNTRDASIDRDVRRARGTAIPSTATS